MTVYEREKLVTILKGARMPSREFGEAMCKADNRTLVEAAKECILKPSSAVVNRQRFEFLLDKLLDRVALLPPLELAEQKAAKAGKGGK